MWVLSKSTIPPGPLKRGAGWLKNLEELINKMIIVKNEIIV
jgi:hypothetical protein